MIRSAGIVVVRKVGGQYLFLLLRSYNFWDHGKGRNEEGETLLETAIREVEEETTLTKDELAFNWGYDSYTTEPYLKGKKTGTYFVAETTREEIDLPISPELGFPEHQEWRWVDFHQAMQMTNERIGKVIQWAKDKITG
jgi:bis(5'-nucleosidyl)-tetraphosphatase